MFEKLTSIFDLFRKGKEVANASAWKAGTISVSALSAFLYAIVKLTKGTQYELPIDEAAVEAFAGAILTVSATIMHIVTSKKAGLLPAKTSSDPLPTIEPVREVPAPIEDHSSY